MTTTRKEVIAKMQVALIMVTSKLDTLTLSDLDSSTVTECQNILSAVRQALEAIK